MSEPNSVGLGLVRRERTNKFLRPSRYCYKTRGSCQDKAAHAVVSSSRPSLSLFLLVWLGSPPYTDKETRYITFSALPSASKSSFISSSSSLASPLRTCIPSLFRFDPGDGMMGSCRWTWTVVRWMSVWSRQPYRVQNSLSWGTEERSGLLTLLDWVPLMEVNERPCLCELAHGFVVWTRETEGEGGRVKGGEGKGEGGGGEGRAVWGFSRRA